MPDAVNMPSVDGNWKGWTCAILTGNELRVRPEIFAAMQEIMAGNGNPDYLSHQALKRAGLTDDEIAGRTFQETKIFVDYKLPVT